MPRVASPLISDANSVAIAAAVLVPLMFKAILDPATPSPSSSTSKVNEVPSASINVSSGYHQHQKM